MGGKSPAGADSPNGAVQLDKYANFEWGSVDIFARQLDILNSSGEPVDVVLVEYRLVLSKCRSWANPSYRSVTNILKAYNMQQKVKVFHSFLEIGMIYHVRSNADRK